MSGFLKSVVADAQSAVAVRPGPIPVLPAKAPDRNPMAPREDPLPPLGQVAEKSAAPPPSFDMRLEPVARIEDAIDPPPAPVTSPARSFEEPALPVETAPPVERPAETTVDSAPIPIRVPEEAASHASTQVTAEDPSPATAEVSEPPQEGTLETPLLDVFLHAPNASTTPAETGPPERSAEAPVALGRALKVDHLENSAVLPDDAAALDMPPETLLRNGLDETTGTPFSGEATPHEIAQSRQTDAADQRDDAPAPYRPHSRTASVTAPTDTREVTSPGPAGNGVPDMSVAEEPEFRPSDQPKLPDKRTGKKDPARAAEPPRREIQPVEARLGATDSAEPVGRAEADIRNTRLPRKAKTEIDKEVARTDPRPAAPAPGQRSPVSQVARVSNTLAQPRPMDSVEMPPVPAVVSPPVNKGPDVRIGQIDVFIEAPKRQQPVSRPAQQGSDGFSSRNYLRRL